MKLRDLIRAVRACKTAAEERAVISKENAMIRTSFKDPENLYRHRNVAKLLFIHMLGYPTHFGQVESLKLIAGGNFPEKRIGYLGLMLLLDEKQEVLMLATNSIKQDFYSKNPYIIGLALCSLGNICSPDMARDLATEVEKFFRHQNAYIRKKAALCAIRCIRKVPELVEDFEKSVVALLNDKNHAVLITTISLLIEIMKVNEKLIKTYRKLVPTIVRLLKNLVLAGYVSEYDVNGITDPFLQAKLIELLRVLGANDREASEAMNDILAQIAINTEPTKNPGNAILYECVQTIMTIEAEGGLRVLAINILGRFLTNRDNNIRYVALNTLCKCVSRDTQAIQRHRNTIVDCLKDADISIRRRALDLIYALVTKNNVKALAKELLNYLSLTSGDIEFKSDLTDKICLVVDRYAPSKQWQIETIISVLTIAGNFTQDHVAPDLILLIARSSTSLQSYATHKLFDALHKKHKTSHLPLIHVGLYCIGEYGDYLITQDGLNKANEAEPKTAEEIISEKSIIELLQGIQTIPTISLLTKEYLLNTAIKLLSRLSSQESQQTLKLIMTEYENSIYIELQQRSCEYRVLSSDSLNKIRNGVVGRMPVPTKLTKKQKQQEEKEKEEEKKREKREKELEKQNKNNKKNKKKSNVEEEEEEESEEESEEAESEEENDDSENEEDDEESEEEEKKAKEIPKSNGKKSAKKSSSSAANTEKKTPAKQPDLLALDIFSGGATSMPVTQQTKVNNNVDLLSDFFGNSSATPTNSTVQPPIINNNSSMNSSDPFAALNSSTPVTNNNSGFFSPSSTTASATSPIPSIGQQSFTPSNNQQASSSLTSQFPPAIVFDKDGLTITFTYSRSPSNPQSLSVTALFSNKTSAEFTGFDFRVAVPKSTILTMQSPSSTTIPSMTEQKVRQELTLVNNLHGTKKLAIKVKIFYQTQGKTVEEQATIGQFPE